MIILGGSWITHTTTATITDVTPAVGSDLQLKENTSDVSANSSIIEASSTNLIVAPEPIAVVEPEEVFTVKQRVIKKGESLGVIFRKEGLGYALPHKISLHPVAEQLTSIAVGKALNFKFDENKQLRQITYPISSLQELVVDIKNHEIADAAVVDLDFKTSEHTVSAEINSSLYEAALGAGLSNNLIMEMVRIFGWDIDFVQDIRKGDEFHVVYTELLVDDKKVADGNILAAEFTTQGQTYRAIRFEDEDGNASFYTPEGESMLGTFLRSPVEFSRISSRFGKRKHPISKKWKAHKGVDYAAARGTPIRATADGKVTHAGRKGGYGNTIVLRHAGTFTTLYAHMNGFAKGIKAGTRVKQGQTIGYVGSTGYSTGPHLHYEFRVNGVHRNSLTYKTPKASSIEPKFKDQFDQLVATLSKKLDGIQQDYMLAKIETDSKKI